MGLDAPHFGFQAPGQHFQGVPDGDLAGDDRSRDHGPEALDGEDPVDGQTKEPFRGTLFHLLRQPVHFRQKRRQAFSGGRGEGNDGRAFQEGPFDKFADFFLDQVQPVLFHQVDFGQGDQPFLHPQQLADIQMLPGLGHDSFIGRNDQSHQVESRGAGHHVADKLFVSRDIDDADFRPAGQSHGGEPQLDGDPALFFFLEAVAVHPGEGLDQSGFPVIDMPGRSQDDAFHKDKSFTTEGTEAEKSKSETQRQKIPILHRRERRDRRVNEFPKLKF